MGPIVVPLREDKVASWKAFIRDLNERRADDLMDMNKRYQLSLHRAWLETGADGKTYAVVEQRGPGAETFIPRLAQSKNPFDVWFRAQISEAHGIDFDNPPRLQPPELVLDAHSP
jgi:hypothetical protein